MRAALLALPVLAICACKPPAVIAVDEWLDGYAAGDAERVVSHTYSEDRELVRAALEQLKTVSTGTLALALPPQPLSHQIVEIESKDNDRGRWIILTKTTLKNPLAVTSKRVGNELQDMPMTRDQRRRFLVIKEGEQWGIKLDLRRVVARDEFVARFEQQVDAHQLDAAEAMLAAVPPPPDEANALHKSDRLVESLRERLAKARKPATNTGASPVPR
jgi:hypothetical protein